MNRDKTTKGPSDFVTAAYNVEDDEGLVTFYRNWAAEYDHEMLDKLQYRSPREIARLLTEYLPDKSARVLDLGCGTGLTVQYLYDLGYRYLDGMDLSADMIKVAASKGIYRNLFAGDLNQPLKFDDGEYHAAVSSGTFTHGHVGAEPLDEIFRVLKPGGLLACTVHFDLWQSRGFEAKFASLMELNAIECIVREAGQYYRDNAPEGWFCLYRKGQD